MGIDFNTMNVYFGLYHLILRSIGASLLYTSLFKFNSHSSQELEGVVAGGVRHFGCRREGQGEVEWVGGRGLKEKGD